MKRFGSLFMAAVMGSVFTVASYQWLGEGDKVKLEYSASVPAAQVAYKVDENGKAVPLDFTVAAEKVMPTVVFIKSTIDGPRRVQNPDARERMPDTPFGDLFEMFPQQQGPRVGSGSGVIISEKGYIVTNNHVVDGADEVEVSLYDNRTYKAEVIGTDPDTDLALIKINQTGLPHLAFVDSDIAKVGEWVLAIGNPYNLNSTVTAGIISAKGRNINILGNRNGGELGSTSIESFIQTDAAINPGNSGGALVNLEGGLLGINTAIASPTGSYSGYGFAVPSNIVSKIVEDLLQFGMVQRGWLGVSITSVNSALVKENDLAVNEGAYVQSFAPASSAKDAGMKEGDVVIKIDKAPIRSNTALIEYIGLHRPGDKVEITVNRKGKELTFPVVLKNRAGKTDRIKPEERDAVAGLGMELEAVDAKVLKNLDLSNGVRIKALGNGKLARFTDIREGFIITKVNEKPVKSVKELNELLKNKKAGELVIFTGIYEGPSRELSYAFRM